MLESLFSQEFFLQSILAIIKQKFYSLQLMNKEGNSNR